MAQQSWQAGTSLDDDPEIRDSIRVMNRQRTTKMLLVIAGIIVGIGVLFAAVYLAYSDEPSAASSPAPTPAAR